MEWMTPEINLIRLRDLTEKLQFSEIVHRADDCEIKELDMEAGTSFMVGLYKDENIAVARNYSSAGCKFPEHVHEDDMVEILIVYQGEMHLTVDGETHIIKKKGEYYILPGQKHSAFFPEESWFLAITIPAAADWPKGG